jgi:nucleotide-binding universal stress UspA family protein
VALGIAWAINLVHKPEATLFGGVLSILFLGVALAYSRGMFRPIAERLPALGPHRAERFAGELPAAQLLTLAEALELQGVERPSVTLALRAFREDLLDEAVARVRAQGEHALYLIYVEEIPGLFYPIQHRPSREAQRVLGNAALYLQREHGLIGIPIWRLAHDAARSLTDAAEALGVKVLVIGTSRRTPVWRLLRGSVTHGLIKWLPRECRLVMVR